MSSLFFIVNLMLENPRTVAIIFGVIQIAMVILHFTKWPKLSHWIVFLPAILMLLLIVVCILFIVLAMQGMH